MGNSIRTNKVTKSILTTLLFFFKKFENGESVLLKPFSMFILIIDYIFFLKKDELFTY